MNTWNLFPATNGPASGTAFAGSYIAGMMWTPKQSGLWCYGYRAWCCNTNQPTTPVKCALRNSLSPTAGDAALVPNSTASTGTLIPGTWNNALLPTPIPVALAAPYIACAAYNGNFPFTISQFGPAEPFASGITQGPLLAYSDSSLGATVNASPFTLPQGCFTTSFSDPTSPGATPANGNNSFNPWVDVILSDIPPAGFTGPYEGWPNMFNAPPGAALDTNQAFNLAHEFDISQRCLVGPAKFWSFTGAASLPTAVGVWDLNTQQLVTANMAPTWINELTGAAGVAGGGKMTTTMPAVVLPPGKYAVSVFNSNGVAGAWSPRVYNYFGTGDGANGISWGPLTIPAQGQAQNAYVFQPNPASTPPYTNGSQQEPSQGRFFFNAFTFPNLAVDFNFTSGAPPGAIYEWFGVDLAVTPVPSLAGAGGNTDGRSIYHKRFLWE